MGNRAVITKNTNPSAPCIYLQWNGGRDSVEAFLSVAQIMQFDPTTAEGWDEFAVFLSEYFFDYDGELGMTIYREEYGRADADNYDNGVYRVDDDWNIVDRLYMNNPEQREYDLYELGAFILNRYLGMDKTDAEAAAQLESQDHRLEVAAERVAQAERKLMDHASKTVH